MSTTFPPEAYRAVIRLAGEAEVAEPCGESPFTWPLRAPLVSIRSVPVRWLSRTCSARPVGPKIWASIARSHALRPPPRAGAPPPVAGFAQEIEQRRESHAELLIAGEPGILLEQARDADRSMGQQPLAAGERGDETHVAIDILGSRGHSLGKSAITLKLAEVRIQSREHGKSVGILWHDFQVQRGGFGSSVTVRSRPRLSPATRFRTWPDLMARLSLQAKGAASFRASRTR
jgi:hypothetical protein